MCRALFCHAAVKFVSSKSDHELSAHVLEASFSKTLSHPNCVHTYLVSRQAGRQEMKKGVQSRLARPCTLLLCAAMHSYALCLYPAPRPVSDRQTP